MAKIAPSILSLEFFYKNSIYLHVRLRERFVNPQLLKQLAVYKINDLNKMLNSMMLYHLCLYSNNITTKHCSNCIK